MLTLIEHYLTEGQPLRITFTDGEKPLAGTFLKASADALLVRTEAGICCVSCRAIKFIQLTESAQTQAPAPSCVTPDADTTAIPAAAEGNGDGTDDDTDTLSDGTDTETRQEEIFSPVFSPKVVGKIDLDSVIDPRRRRHQQNATSGITPDNPLVPASGTVVSIGPAFGFIATADGESLFFSRAEVMQRHRNDDLYKGASVVFTPGQNARGGVARCVHSQLTVQEQLEWIERIRNYDARNARMLAEQLIAAFPDDSELTDTLESLNLRPRRADVISRAAVPVAQTVLDDVRHGHYVEPAHLLKAERELSATLPYAESFPLINELLTFATVNSRQQCYQLFARMIKLARINGDDTAANALMDKALEFYADEAGARAYFENLRRKAQTTPQSEPFTPASRPAPTPEEAADRAVGKIMQHMRNNVMLVGEDASQLDKAMSIASDRLDSDPACLCINIDLEGMPADSDLALGSFIEIVTQLTAQANEKFHMEIPLPAADLFEGTDDMTAPAQAAAAIKKIRAAIASQPDAPQYLHIVAAFADLSRVISSMDSEHFDPNHQFVRNIKRMADIHGTELQLLFAVRADSEPILQQMPGAAPNLRQFFRVKA